MQEPRPGESLSAFLKAARGRIAPRDAGLPTSGLRRVPGLRREEVAALIGVSDAWYARFEANRATMSDKALNRLADVLALNQPQRLQLFALARPQLQSALSTGSVESANAAAGALFGRDRDLECIAAYLEGPQRLVTITGPPGVGKTSLARVAAQHAHARGAHVHEVALESLTTPALMLEKIAADAGARREPGADIASTIAAHLADKPALLVLDAVEHVVSAAPLLDRLFTKAPKLRVLATGRRAFRRDDERIYELAPLEVPAGDVAAVRDSPAAQLLLERARSHGIFVASTESSLLALRDTLRLVEGMPLAIELIVPRLRRYSLQEIAAELRANGILRLAADARGKGKSLRAAIASSFVRLRENERDVLRVLATAPAPVRTAQLATICAAAGCTSRDRHDIEVIVDLLVEQHLLKRVEDRVGISRFAPFDAVRDYVAAESLAPKLRDEIRAAHARCYLALVLSAKERYSTLRQAEAFDELDGDADNLRAAFDFFLDRASAADALSLAHSLAPYWNVRGHAPEAVDHLRRLLPKLDPQSSNAATALSTLAVFALTMSDYELAISSNLSAIAIYRKRNERPDLARVRGNLGIVFSQLARHTRAVPLFEFAIASYRETGNAVGLANTLGNLGWSLLHLGRFDEAHDVLQDALQLRSSMGDRWSAANTLGSLAHLELARERGTPARTFLRRALPVFAEFGDNRGYAKTLDALAAAFASEGLHERAAWLCGFAAEFRHLNRISLGADHRDQQDTTSRRCVDALGEDRYFALTGEGARARASQVDELLR